MADLRRPKGKRKYTHTGVRINYYGENRVVFLHKTPKQWQDPSGTWFNAQGKQMGLYGLPPTCELDLTTIRAIEDR